MQLFQALFPAHRSLSLAGALFGVGLFAAGLANPAHWLQSGFETALNESTTPLHLADAKRPVSPLVAGTESYWLGTSSATVNTHMVQPTTWQAPVAKGVTEGDRFTISSRQTTSGRTTADVVKREFEVVTIEPLLTAHSRDAVGKTAAKQDTFLVICRSTDKHNPETVKFLIDSTSGLPWAVTPARTAHAL